MNRAASVAPSKFSKMTYINSLEEQLDHERVARLKLENEIEEIKRINAEITSKLASSHASEF
jgi:hypothetical protein